MLLGWSGKAASTWKYLVDRFPDNLELLRQWGVSYLVVGQNDKARDVFQKVTNSSIDQLSRVSIEAILIICLDPCTPQPLYNMVRYNMVLDNTDQCWTPNCHF